MLEIFSGFYHKKIANISKCLVYTSTIDRIDMSIAQAHKNFVSFLKNIFRETVIYKTVYNWQQRVFPLVVSYTNEF